MEENVITTSGLDFSFSSSQKILNDVGFIVPRGSIYGFLGSNGAGKTTTLKLLLGLIKKQKGSISIFGKDPNQDRISILKRIGSLIEQPSLYSHLTARENMEVFRLSYQCGRKRIDTVLDIVGLVGTANKKVGAFSLGMKQRLAIAIALLHDPELLILDEPSNGLDPNGMIDMRRLIIELNEKYNKTILISSHLLAEVEKLATHVGIIHHGKLLYQGKMTDLHAQHKPRLNVETSDDVLAKVILEKSYSVGTADKGLLINIDDKASIGTINRTLVENGIEVYNLSSTPFELEHIFMQTLNT